MTEIDTEKGKFCQIVPGKNFTILLILTFILEMKIVDTLY